MINSAQNNVSFGINFVRNIKEKKYAENSNVLVRHYLPRMLKNIDTCLSVKHKDNSSTVVLNKIINHGKNSDNHIDVWEFSGVAQRGSGRKKSWKKSLHFPPGSKISDIGKIFREFSEYLASTTSASKKIKYLSDKFKNYLNEK